MKYTNNGRIRISIPPSYPIPPYFLIFNKSLDYSKQPLDLGPLALGLPAEAGGVRCNIKPDVASGFIFCDQGIYFSETLLNYCDDFFV